MDKQASMRKDKQYRSAYQELRLINTRKALLKQHKGAARDLVIDHVCLMFEGIGLDHYVLFSEVYKDAKRPIERKMRRLSGIDDWTLNQTFFKQTLQSPKCPLHFEFCRKVMRWVQHAPEPTMYLKKPSR